MQCVPGMCLQFKCYSCSSTIAPQQFGNFILPGNSRILFTHLKERFKFKDSSYLLIGTTGILLVVQELKLKSFTVFDLKVCYSCGIEKEMSRETFFAQCLTTANKTKVKKEAAVVGALLGKPFEISFSISLQPLS